MSTGSDELLLLLRSDTHRVTAWLRRGSVPAYVVPVGGWSAVVPAGQQARTSAPYHEAVTMLIGRPVPSGLRAALGFAVVDDRAVLVVHPPGWRAVPRWLFWQTGTGAAATHLPTLRAADLMRVSGIGREDLARVDAVIADRQALPVEMLRDLIDALGLPGGTMLGAEAAKHAPGAALVEPDDRAVRRFDRLTREERDLADEVNQS